MFILSVLVTLLGPSLALFVKELPLSAYEILVKTLTSKQLAQIEEVF